MADQTFMDLRGVAWWGHNRTAGTCTCCGKHGYVYRGYNGSQGLSVYCCSPCTQSRHCPRPKPLLSDAHERLARRLYIDDWAAGDPALHAKTARRWDQGEVPSSKRAEYLDYAGQLIALITGQEH